QTGLWLTWQLNPESAAYNMSGVLAISGDLNKTALTRSVEALIARHDVLNTLFVLDGDVVKQHVQTHCDIDLACFSLATVAEAEAKATALSQQAFTLDSERPIRVSIIDLPEQQYHVVVSIHHIVADGWSLNIFIEELIALYVGFVEGEAPSLAELP
ncbi:hypothetical protein J3L16_15945, partial [Alteromonas sp. 5E99-2]|uniref:condensation domain-containing protein n=1 Tax=Alteromonas sp. 5E99-2 TaxID=2817683 RepID=UPI001AC4105E